MPILVAVAGAHDIVEKGLRAILTGDREVEVMDRFPVLGVVPDVILYDAVAVDEDDGAELNALAKEQDSALVVVGRDLRPDLASRAMANGADGVISIEAPAAEILGILHTAAAGDLDPSNYVAMGPGAEAGLTAREAEVVAWVAKGCSNAEIGALLGLSHNSIKSYIRSAYRKMQVTTRAQAVAWCVQHGFGL